MRKIRVGINGFGRIGRAIYRINRQRDLFDIIAINDINPDIKNIAYLLQYDSTYGRLSRPVIASENHLLIEDDKKTERIAVHHEQDISNVPWDRHEIDLVIDSSGVKANVTSMLKTASKVKNFIVTNDPSASFDKEVKTIIFGVNENELDSKSHKIFSSSICDTIALSPLLKLLTKDRKIESGFLTTLHPWLSYQNLLDGPSVSWSQPGDVNSHYALGRASTQNIIPKSTSAILAAERVFPGLSNIVQSFSYRIPTAIVSSAVLVLLLDKNIEQKEILESFQAFEKQQKHQILRNSVEPLTSIDYIGENSSAIVDHRWTKVENGRHVKLVYWYDNEWGYSSRAVDLVKAIGDQY